MAALPAQLRSNSAALAPRPRRSSRCAAQRPSAASGKGEKGGKAGTQRIYVGKGKFVQDDPAKYPGREANNAAGGWAGGEKGLWQLREELKAMPPTLPPPPKPSGPRGSSIDVNLKKDFNAMAGGFPGGEVGVRAFTETGKVATRSAPPSVGFGAYVAVAVAASYAAVVYSTGDLNPADWEFTTAAPGGAPATEAVASGKKQVVLPKVDIDTAVAARVAPPAAVAGGVVLAGVALQTAVRKLTDSIGRGTRVALFGSLVLAAAFKILGLL